MTEPLIDPDCRDRKHRVCAGGPCECPCHEPARPSRQVVAQMASALAFIARRHRPDFTNGAVQALTCRCCSQIAGIPVEWPCPDRQAVGRLLEDPANRLLPPEPPAAPPSAGAGVPPPTPGRLTPRPAATRMLPASPPVTPQTNDRAGGNP